MQHRKQNLLNRCFKSLPVRSIGVLSFALLAFIALGKVKTAQASSLLMSPSGGSFTIDSTFDVSLYLDTQGNSVNAVQLGLKFPPDKLQLVSPTTGHSIITLWVTQPSYDNQSGTVSLRGVIPGGITTSHGIITTLTFRVKSVGSASVRYTDDSKILLNDGFGTADNLSQLQNGIYQLTLPPPAGPIVTSDTHPDQSHWYADSSVLLRWENDTTVEGYSYIMSDDPGEIPDDISEGVRNQISYQNTADGVHYFHIKALRDGNWGGTTHFAVHVDTTPPAQFPVALLPHATTDRQPVVQFSTTDASSGIDHYELKLLPLDQASPAPTSGSGPLFIEATSPYVLQQQLTLGHYDIIVRAYDQAGNFQESTGHLNLVSSHFIAATNEGLQIASQIIVPWLYVLLVGLALLVLLFLLGLFFRKRHRRISELQESGTWPSHISDQLQQLKAYQERYGKLAVVVLILMFSFTFFGHRAKAQDTPLNPPVITTVSNNISNQEIFYVGGKTDTGDTQVVLYLQNLKTGETLSENITSDKRGDWFYRHNSFLSTGDYRLWVQSKLDGQLSPPSPQISLSVRPTALQFGVSRLSYGTIYVIIIVLLVLINFILFLYMLFHARHARRKHRQYQHDMRQAEESIRRGFAFVHRDVQAEYNQLQAAGGNVRLADFQEKEAQLLKDLEFLENYIGKEIWDAEHADPAL